MGVQVLDLLSYHLIDNMCITAVLIFSIELMFKDTLL